MILRILFFLIVVLCLPSAGSAQRRYLPDTRKNVRLVEKKPTIYLEFVRLGTCSRAKSFTVLSSSPCESKRDDIQLDKFEAVWLRVHNNSRWAIGIKAGNLYVFPMADGFTLQDRRTVTAANDGVDIDLQYDVEAERGYERVETEKGTEYQFIDVKPPYIERLGAFSQVWIPPGRSVIFAVKRQYLAKHLMVYLPYKYEWETSQKEVGFEEPEHRAYFSWYKYEKALSEKNRRAEQALGADSPVSSSYS
jgi:hypothetical protein